MPRGRADDELAGNRALWDARATVHGSTPDDRFYNVDSFLAGGLTLYSVERELAGDVTGRDLLHLQCHFGMDTLSWARLGATVTGVDFSPALVDLHPAYQTLGSYEPLMADWPYGGGEPQRETVTATYADERLRMQPQEITQYPHSVGEIVTAAADAGLLVDRLSEHTSAEFDPRGILPQSPDGRYRLPFSATHLPVLYSLRALAPDGERMASKSR